MLVNRCKNDGDTACVSYLCNRRRLEYPIRRDLDLTVAGLVTSLTRPKEPLNGDAM